MKTERYLCLALLLIFSLFSANAAEYHPPCKEKGVHPAIVLVSGHGGGGLGFVFEKNKVLTANHVVAGGKDAILYFQPNFHEEHGTVIASDSAKDLAIIETETQEIQPIVFATIAAIRMNVRWYDAYVATNEIKTSCGRIVAKSSSQALGENTWSSPRILEDKDLQSGHELILEISGRSTQGSSGGPIFNAENQVVGIRVAAANPLVPSKTTSYAVSIDGIRKFLISQESMGESK